MVKTRSLYVTRLFLHRAVTDGRTDGQTDRIAIANTRLNSTCRYSCGALKIKNYSFHLLSATKFRLVTLVRQFSERYRKSVLLSCNIEVKHTGIGFSPTAIESCAICSVLFLKCGKLSHVYLYIYLSFRL